VEFITGGGGSLATFEEGLKVSSITTGSGISISGFCSSTGGILISSVPILISGTTSSVPNKLRLKLEKPRFMLISLYPLIFSIINKLNDGKETL
jgi:hypothetical protein